MQATRAWRYHYCYNYHSHSLGARGDSKSGEEAYRSFKSYLCPHCYFQHSKQNIAKEYCNQRLLCAYISSGLAFRSQHIGGKFFSPLSLSYYYSCVCKIHTHNTHLRICIVQRSRSKDVPECKFSAFHKTGKQVEKKKWAKERNTPTLLHVPRNGTFLNHCLERKLPWLFVAA